MKKKGWGFDVRDMDRKVRPQDDFYHYASGGWLKKNPIPATESRWGSFTILRYETEKQLRTLLDRLDSSRRFPTDSPEQMVRDYYRSGMNLKERTRLGTKPIAPYLKTIDNIKSIEDLFDCIAAFHKTGVDVVWGTGVDQDMKNSDTHILYLGQGGLGLPDRDYYLKDDTESVRVRKEYRPHISKIFQLLGMKKSEAKQAADTVFDIEHKLAKVSMRKEDTREVEKIYNKRSLVELQKLAPTINWKKYLKSIDAGSPSSVVVCQPAFFKEMSGFIKSVSIEDWKTYLRWHLVSAFSGYLSPAFVRQSFKFYGTVLTGRPKMRPLWRQVLGVVNSNLDELLGKVYVKEHFTPAAKRKAEAMVADLFTAYEARIKQLDWMSPATKKKALGKLRTMVRKIGYPDKWKSYKGLHISPTDYVGNAVRTSLFEHKRAMRKLKKKVDRTEWFMSPQTVNAYCNPSMNEIVFPAAILQPPFFDPEGDDGINYGSMGMVIGHEITHNFDDQGSKFNARGSLENWWTPADRKRFEKKTKVLVKQFNQYKVVDGVPVNGKLTLGENVADLGGTSIALDAYRLQLTRTGRHDIDGFTPEQRFFLGGPMFEQENTRPEFEKMLAINDPHSPPIFRVNGVLSNLPEFFEAYGVKKGDKLFRSPSSRAKIW